MDSTREVRRDATESDRWNVDVCEPGNQDSDEDEIFFGPVSAKEKSGTFYKLKKRETICENDRRRSYDTTTKKRGSDFFSLNTTKKSSLYGAENSITEEDDEEDNEVFASPLPSAATTFHTAMQSLSIHDEDKENVSMSEDCVNLLSINPVSLNITKRRGRRGENDDDETPGGRRKGGSLISLPSVNSVHRHFLEMELQEQEYAPNTAEEGFDTEGQQKELEIVNISTRSKLESADEISLSDGEDSVFSPGVEGDVPAVVGTCSVAGDGGDDAVELPHGLSEEGSKVSDGSNRKDDRPIPRIKTTYPSDEDITTDNIWQKNLSVGNPTDPDNAEAEESVETDFLPDLVKSVPSIDNLTRKSRLSTATLDSSMESLNFNTTLEEMMLYGMLGEEYDEVVERMTRSEKKDLKRRMEDMSLKEKKELFDRLEEVRQEDENSLRASGDYMEPSPRTNSFPFSLHDQAAELEVPVMRDSVASTISPFSLGSGTPSSTQLNASNVTPGTRATTRQERRSPAISPTPPAHCQDLMSPAMLPAPPAHCSELRSPDVSLTPAQWSENQQTDDDQVMEREIRSVEKPLEPSSVSPLTEHESHYHNIPLAPGYPTYLLPTYSSLHRHTEKSPQKPVRVPWLPPSPSPKSNMGTSPTPTKKVVGGMGPPQPSSRPNGSSAILPARPVGSSTPSHRGENPLHCLRSPAVFRTPVGSATKSRIPTLKSGADSVVESPVGQYVRNNPAPHLVHNVKSKLTEDLESTLMETKENQEETSFPALPSASYTSAKLAQDVEYDNTGKDYQLHKAFGQTQTLVKVTRHIDRARLPLNSITWNDEQLVYTESLMSTPRLARTKKPEKSLLKKTQRDSGLFDESMLEISVHQTQVVKKIAGKGRGRGTGKGRGKK